MIKDFRMKGKQRSAKKCRLNEEERNRLSFFSSRSRSRVRNDRKLDKEAKNLK